ncbi:hypothetical protein ACFY2Q_17060 [Micromonospora sp. NPDC000316]|uniref:hypothetical protein n=1 Tax=Micromonospora sp. NPDC000316 TaxID=3364216 RepID=UPI0036A52C3B
MSVSSWASLPMPYENAPSLPTSGFDVGPYPYPYPYPPVASQSPQGPYDYPPSPEQPVAVDDPATTEFERWADQEVANGLTAVANGDEFQLGTYPHRPGEMVVVPTGSPLATPNHTPSGSPPRSTHSGHSLGAPAGAPAGDGAGASWADTFRLYAGQLQQRGRRGWELVRNEAVGGNVLYAVGSALEAFGRSNGVPYAISTGNAVILSADIIPKVHSIYTNLTSPQVNMPRLAKDAVNVVGLTAGIAAGYTLISGVNRDLSTNDHLTIDRSHVRAAGYLGGGSAVAFGAGAVFAGMENNRAAARPADTETGSERHRSESHRPESHRPESHRPESHRSERHRSESHRSESHRSRGRTSETAGMAAPRTSREHGERQPAESSSLAPSQHESRHRDKGKARATR